MQRCKWVGNDSLMQMYHDTEWGKPVHDNRALWESMVLEGFQSGLSWKTVLHKRENFRRAFYGFVPEKIVAMNEEDRMMLYNNNGIIRSRAKIQSVFKNASAFLKLQDKGIIFSDMIWEYIGFESVRCYGKSNSTLEKTATQLSKDLKKLGFSFIGPVTAYSWMQAVGMINDHENECSYSE